MDQRCHLGSLGFVDRYTLVLSVLMSSGWFMSSVHNVNNVVDDFLGESLSQGLVVLVIYLHQSYLRLGRGFSLPNGNFLSFSDACSGFSLLILRRLLSPRRGDGYSYIVGAYS